MASACLCECHLLPLVITYRRARDPVSEVGFAYCVIVICTSTAMQIVLPCSSPGSAQRRGRAGFTQLLEPGRDLADCGWGSLSFCAEQKVFIFVSDI